MDLIKLNELERVQVRVKNLERLELTSYSLNSAQCHRLHGTALENAATDIKNIDWRNAKVWMLSQTIFFKKRKIIVLIINYKLFNVQ